MINIVSMRNITSKPGAVLGGGPSLKADMKRLPAGTILISVNDHALKYCWPEYMVFMDDPDRHGRERLLEAILRYAGVIVSPVQKWTDVDLSGADYWKATFSSHLATWFACWIGCNPVYLCGMDCYQNPLPPEENPRNNAYKTPLEEHVRLWRQAFEKCPNADRIKAVSGPLVEVFGR
jgi:hypothetical protein